jgi:chromosome segregation ATPase
LAEQAVQDEELASQTDSFQTERGRLAQGLEVSNANLQKQMERADELQTQLDLLLQQNADCEEKMSTLANEIDQMKTANRDLENRLNTTEEMKSTLNSEVDILKESLSESREENVGLHQEIELLKASNNHLQKQAEESQDTYENNIQQLQMDWEKERDQLTLENNQLAEQATSSMEETNQLHQSLVLRGRELDECQSRLTSLKQSVSNLEASLSSEKKMRQDLNTISAKKDFDIGKLRKELQENVKQIASLEAANKSLQSSLDTKSEECLQLRDELDIEKVAHQASQTERDVVESKLSQAELKVEELTSQVSEVIATKDTLEQKVQSTVTMKNEYQMHQEQMETFRVQLRHEQLERAQVQQTAAELRAKLEAVQENDITSRSTIQHLQLRVSELETNFEAQKQKYRRVQQRCKQSEATKALLQEEMTVLLRQSEAQKNELVLLNEEVDLQGHRYTEGKRRSSEKYLTAKEKFGRERRSLESSVELLQDELEMAKRRLSKENEWRSRAEEIHRELLRDKQHLVEKLGQVEDREREKAHTVRQLEHHVVRLEQENTALQDRLQRVLNEKLRLETLVREPMTPEV